MTSANEILNAAAGAIGQRAALRDAPAGERSMHRTITTFNTLTGHRLSEHDGWIFMIALKLARAHAGGHHLDDYIDASAYAALAGECVERSCQGAPA